jgi:hypothetical protein
VSASGLIAFEWADGEHRFRLPIGRLRELQDKCGAGPGVIFGRLTDGTWRVDDLREVVRLGLIGGGMDPVQALTLVKRYVDERPLAETVAPARVILAVALFGDGNDTVGKNQPEEADTMTGSASPSFTAPEPPSDGQPARSMN